MAHPRLGQAGQGCLRAALVGRLNFSLSRAMPPRLRQDGRNDAECPHRADGVAAEYGTERLGAIDHLGDELWQRQAAMQPNPAFESRSARARR